MHCLVVAAKLIKNIHNLQMSPVELGGATVFPSLGARIPPTYVRL